MQGIRGRIISTYLVLIFISMAVLGILLIWLLQDYTLFNLRQNMANQAALAADLLNKQIAEGRYETADRQVKFLGKKMKVRFTVVLPDGTVVADSQLNPYDIGNHRDREEIRKAFLGVTGFQTRVSDTTGIKTMYAAVPLEINGKIAAVVRVSLPLKEINRAFLKLRGILLAGILAATGVGVLLSFKLAQGLTEPIESINKGAQKIVAGEWSTRVYSGGKDEIGELGRSINYMTKTLKEKIDEVSQEKSRFENILYTMVSGVIVLDHYGLVRVINPAAEEIFGVSFATAEGKHNLEVIRLYGLNERIEQCLTKEKVINYEFTVNYPEEKILQCYIAPVYRDQALSGVTMVFHDITRLRKLEQMRADFVANASHELRTPLTVIKGYAETLLGGALDDRDASKKFVQVMDQEANRLQRLVDELLILSRVESYTSQGNVESLDIISIIRSATDEIRQRFIDKGLELNLDIPAALALVAANRDRVKQVLVNLLDNALKYTPSGGNVLVTASEDERDVKISVKDTGIGIPRKDFNRIFERFYRVDKARSRQMGGFGLGLSIVKHIVESSGGKIGVNSNPNEGSTFWFTLPKVNG